MDMIENVAQAINNATCDDLGCDRDDDWQVYIPEAKAAIAAMTVQAEPVDLPDFIDLFRIIRKAGRSDRAKAQAVFDALTPLYAHPPAQWQGIESAPSGIPIIGLRDPSQTGRQPAFIGEVYDLRKNALIDVWSGRWAVCTHWMPLPTPPAAGGSDAE